MYKILIADDEETIREGLSDIVDWKSLGFEVVRVVEDGSEVIEYIKENHIDVILTDIKMTFTSGIEVAQYVRSNNPDINVVIISGHQEFEYARQAITYNVKHYLLKPTRMDELRRVFSELKKELDEKYSEKEKNERENEEKDRLKLMLQEQFFTDLIMGAVPNSEAVDKRLKGIGLDIDPASSKLCVVDLKLSYMDNKLPEEADEENESLYSALRKYFSRRDSDTYYFTIYDSYRKFKIIAIFDKSFDNDTINSRVMSFIKNIQPKIESLMGISLSAGIERIFDSMYDTGIFFKPVSDGEKTVELKIQEVISTMDYSHLLRQQKLLVSYIKSENREMANSIFDNMMNELKLVDVKVIHNWILSLFAGLKNDLADSGIDIHNEIFDYGEVLKLKDISGIRNWGCTALDKVLNHICSTKGDSEKAVIQKAKEYINGNYFKDMGLEEVADSVFLNSIYFSRLFKSQTGENFVDYLVKVRVRKAMELLRNQKLKVYEVSSRVGYKNSKYFYKLFKEQTGFTPAEYRENALRKGEINEE